ncbi:MAG: biotin/lipoyl-binding protein, partial [Polyangiaceae bacterium]
MIENAGGPTDRLLARLALVLLALASGAGCRTHASVPPGLQGLLEYDERIIGFELAGRVKEVPVHRGQVVDAGDVLARLDDRLEL